jgi:hypothetical protein
MIPSVHSRRERVHQGGLDDRHVVGGAQQQLKSFRAVFERRIPIIHRLRQANAGQFQFAAVLQRQENGCRLWPNSGAH